MFKKIFVSLLAATMVSSVGITAYAVPLGYSDSDNDISLIENEDIDFSKDTDDIEEVLYDDSDDFDTDDEDMIDGDYADDSEDGDIIDIPYDDTEVDEGDDDTGIDEGDDDGSVELFYDNLTSTFKGVGTLYLTYIYNDKDDFVVADEDSPWSLDEDADIEDTVTIKAPPVTEVTKSDGVYKFEGWLLRSDCNSRNGDILQPGDKITIADENDYMLLYAIWVKDGESISAKMQAMLDKDIFFVFDPSYTDEDGVTYIKTNGQWIELEDDEDEDDGDDECGEIPDDIVYGTAIQDDYSRGINIDSIEIEPDENNKYHIPEPTYHNYRNYEFKGWYAIYAVEDSTCEEGYRVEKTVINTDEEIEGNILGLALYAIWGTPEETQAEALVNLLANLNNEYSIGTMYVADDGITVKYYKYKNFEYEIPEFDYMWTDDEFKKPEGKTFAGWLEIISYEDAWDPEDQEDDEDWEDDDWDDYEDEFDEVDDTDNEDLDDDEDWEDDGDEDWDAYADDFDEVDDIDTEDLKDDEYDEYSKDNDEAIDVCSYDIGDTGEVQSTEDEDTYYMDDEVGEDTDNTGRFGEKWHIKYSDSNTVARIVKPGDKCSAEYLNESVKDGDIDLDYGIVYRAIWLADGEDIDTVAREMYASEMVEGYKSEYFGESWYNDSEENEAADDKTKETEDKDIDDIEDIEYTDDTENTEDEAGVDGEQNNETDTGDITDKGEDATYAEPDAAPDDEGSKSEVIEDTDKNIDKTVIDNKDIADTDTGTDDTDTDDTDTDDTGTADTDTAVTGTTGNTGTADTDTNVHSYSDSNYDYNNESYDSVVRTGDTFPIATVGVISAISALIIAVLTFIKRRRGNNDVQE